MTEGGKQASSQLNNSEEVEPNPKIQSSGEKKQLEQLRAHYHYAEKVCVQFWAEMLRKKNIERKQCIAVCVLFYRAHKMIKRVL